MGTVRRAGAQPQSLISARAHGIFVSNPRGTALFALPSTLVAENDVSVEKSWWGSISMSVALSRPRGGGTQHAKTQLHGEGGCAKRQVSICFVRGGRSATGAHVRGCEEQRHTLCMGRTPLPWSSRRRARPKAVQWRGEGEGEHVS